jgi:hypothetical protein
VSLELAFLLVCLLLGLRAPQLGRGEWMLISVLATLATVLYFIAPNRFM